MLKFLRTYKFQRSGSVVTRILTTADFGKAIRAERKNQQLTQTDLAEVCGVSLSFISNLENGKVTAELGKAFKVVQTLGLDLTLNKRGA